MNLNESLIAVDSSGYIYMFFSRCRVLVIVKNHLKSIQLEAALVTIDILDIHCARSFSEYPHSPDLFVTPESGTLKKMRDPIPIHGFEGIDESGRDYSTCFWLMGQVPTGSNDRRQGLHSHGL